MNNFDDKLFLMFTVGIIFGGVGFMASGLLDRTIAFSIKQFAVTLGLMILALFPLILMAKQTNQTQLNKTGG